MSSVLAFGIFVADPGLNSASGHHAGALATLSAIRGLGELIFLGYREPDEDLCTLVQRLRVDFRPLFRNYFYEGFDKDWTIAESQAFVSNLAADYLTLFEQIEIAGASDMVLHHTMDWPHLLALSSALQLQRAPRPTQTHVVFLMFNPGVDHQTHVRISRRYLNYRVALSMLCRNAQVKIFAAGSELTEIYRSAFKLPLQVGVHPCFFFNAAAAVKGIEPGGHSGSASSGEHVLLYVGDAKAEKGFCELPDLVRKFLRYSVAETKFVIHYVLNEGLSSEPLLRAAMTLEDLARQDSRLTLCQGFLPEDGLMALLRASSCVVFNYHSAIYADKTSGLLWQACSVCAPIAVIGDSWLSREARRTNPFVRVFDDVSGLGNELKRTGTIVFQLGAVDEEYRQSLFRPMEAFFRETLSQGMHDAIQTAPVRRVLFVDSVLPNPKASAGGHAAWQEMAMFQALGYSVVFVPLDGCTPNEEACAEFRRRSVELCRLPDWPDASAVLERRGREFNVVFITRFNVAEALVNAVREYAPQAKIVLNVADLHYVREMRRAEILGDSAAMVAVASIRQRELAVVSNVDMVLTYTDEEMAIIHSELGNRITVRKCPWVEVIYTEVASFESRRDLAFLGGFAHAPNADGVIWFANNVMPLLSQVLPEVCLRIYGANVPSAVLSCANNHVVIEGFVEDLSCVYDRCRLFIAPLRFGAGLKGKVAGALCRGVPCVLSSVAAEGITAGGETFAATAQSPQAWVEQIVRLYTDEQAWNTASEMALGYAKERYSAEGSLVQMKAILDELAQA